MRTIQIENGTYDILELVARIRGESHSDVVSRLLIDEIKGHLPQVASAGSTSHSKTLKGGALITPTPLQEFLKTSTFLVHGNVKQRFLAMLSWLYKQNRSDFAKVKGLRGTNRLYFAESEGELEASGNSVNPKRVPDSPYWVVTNSPTQGKKKLLSDVMRVLGYSSADIHTAVQALG